ncbi:MAG: DUF4358 domain-containing protein [Ruminococcus sp.]|jgi:hypothetical protein|nr:DUF4358 domain-containing protein [Ruminococcus sp.]
MKKICSLLAALTLSFVMLTGCSSTSVDLSAAMTDIKTQCSFELKQLSTTDDLQKYYNIAPEDVKQFAAEIYSDSTTRIEIVLVEAVDAEATERVNEALTTTYNSIINQYAGYNQEKLPLIEACKVTQDGNYVSLIVAENGPELLETYYNHVK